MDHPSRLFIFTTGYPFGDGERTFLDPEISYLANAFQVTLIPASILGPQNELPPNVCVEEGYARFLSARTSKLSSLLRALRSKSLYVEFFKNFSRFFSLANIDRLVRMVSRSRLTYQWFSRYLQSHGLENEDLLCYTYWLEQYTLGIGLVKKKYPAVRLVSRAHGYDLYKHIYPFDYIPFQEETLRLLDGLVLISQKGQAYINSLYTWFSPRSRVSYLGIKDPESRSRFSAPGEFQVVSCSRVIPIKCVDQIGLGVAKAAAERPDQKVAWTHFGNGPELDKVKELLVQTAPSNLTVSLPGYVPNTEVLSFYRQHPVDLFINASRSEGIPVTLMEAAACGIPLMATAVGGNPEIVNEGNGFLLPSGSGSDAIAEQLVKVFDQPVGLHQKRLASRKVWEQNFNIAVNAAEFIKILKTVGTARSSGERHG